MRHDQRCRAWTGGWGECRPGPIPKRLLFAAVGYPRTIRVDQGSEFVSRDRDLWAYAKGVTLDLSRLGKPTDIAFIEAFNGRFRSECLNAHWFLTLADAREKMADWLGHYNEVRPHGAIGHRPPISLQNPGGIDSQPP